MMVERRLKGHSLPAIAAEFNVSIDTVEREVKRAKRLGLLDNFSEQIISELLPKAISAFGAAMDKGDTSIAREVFKGLGFLLSPQDRAAATTVADSDDDLEGYLRQHYGGGGSERTQFKPGPRGGRPALAPAGPSITDEGSVLEGAVIRPAPAAPAVGSDGDENRPADQPRSVESADDHA